MNVPPKVEEIVVRELHNHYTLEDDVDAWTDARFERAAADSSDRIEEQLTGEEIQAAVALLEDMARIPDASAQVEMVIRHGRYDWLFDDERRTRLQRLLLDIARWLSV